MTDLDRESLTSFLSLYIEELSRSYTQRLEDDPEDRTALRMGGAVESLSVVLSNVQAGKFDVESWPGKRKPVSEIQIPVMGKVRKRDPETSWDAAVSQTPEKSQRLYKAIRILLSSLGPMTDDELLAELEKRSFPHSDSGVRTRRRELTDAGWVKDSGQKRSSKKGHPSTVWETVKEES